MTNKIEVYKIGTKIKVGDDIPATIVGVALYTSSIEYKIVYWDGKTRKIEWIDESEFDTISIETKEKIGFK